MEARGRVTLHVGNVLHIDSTISYFVLVRDVGLVIGHGEEDSGVTHGVLSMVIVKWAKRKLDGI